MYKTNKMLSIVGILCGIMVFTLSFKSSFYTIIAFIISFILISSLRLFLIKEPMNSLKDISPIVVGIIYIPTLLLAQWHLRLKGYEWIIFLYSCVWISDSFAYYIGKGFGKRKLYISVSPNKTVEGAIGSVIGGIISSSILGGILNLNINFIYLMLIGIIIGSITIIGDLVESMFKRDAKVKDSGSFIPGHGGILDKIDGVLFAGPTLFFITLVI